ncbi:MAG TPA: hypothetical protein VN809_06640 [Telmatospirillum sp.]|nr:hypothetical protein [Telmatospirillum sp.]
MSATAKGSARLRAIQYGVVAQLSVIGMINYLDRATLAIANPLVRQDMGLSVAQMLWLSCAMFFGQLSGSFTVPLIAGAVISTIGAAIYWFVPKRPITVNDLAEQPR